jgi:Fe-S cluster assembly ATP-binding protein
MLKENVLEINNLSVAVDGKNILHNVNLALEMGETHVLFGPNGGGKSTLLMTIMGSPKYRVTEGSILYKGQNIVNLPIDERARLGIGMSVQRPPVIRGVKTRDLVAACLQNRADETTIEEIAEMADMTEFLNRDVNYGFSGGEVKRSEMMQLLAQSPELALLDEPESGVDLVNISLIGNLINDLLQKEHPMRDRKRSGLIITHTGHILDFVSARTGYVMLNGTIICEGDPREILDTIKKKGYEECKKCAI